MSTIQARDRADIFIAPTLDKNVHSLRRDAFNLTGMDDLLVRTGRSDDADPIPKLCPQFLHVVRVLKNNITAQLSLVSTMTHAPIRCRHCVELVIVNPIIIAEVYLSSQMRKALRNVHVPNL